MIFKLESLLVLAAALLAAGWLVVMRHDQKVTAKVTTQIVQASKQEGARREKAAQKAITTARRIGAFDRLRQDARACPDCPRGSMPKLGPSDDQQK